MGRDPSLKQTLMNKKKLIVAGSIVAMLAGGVYVAKARGWLNFKGTVKTYTVDLSKPDAWIRTNNLSQLPRDLLKVPLARDVLSEDFVFYYEQHEDRLGLRGSLRRIAYEHQLQWEDRLLEVMLDEAGEVALWRDARGGLRYYLLAMTRNQLTKIVQQALELGAKSSGDSQLSKLGEISVSGDKVGLLVLKYGQQNLVFAARGNRVVLLSDPGMVVDGEQKVLPEAQKVLARLLDGEAKAQQIYSEHFGIKDNKAKHSMVLDAHYLSFGYQHFFAGLQALRFDFSTQGQWSSSVLFDGEQLPAAGLQDKAIWAGLPMDPAACALLPVNWQMGNKVLGSLPSEKMNAFLAQLDGPAAICWYAQSTLHTPLLVAHTKPGSKPDPEFVGSLFAWAIKEAEAKPQKGKDASLLWQARVEAPFAWDQAGAKAKKQKKKDAAEEGSGPSYLASLAQKDDYLLFSPDAKLVELGLSSLNKRYPSLRDALAKDGSTLAVLVPSKLGNMARQESEEVLTAPGEEIFLGAAKEHLWPKLDALKKYPAYRLKLAATPGKEKGWQTVEWQVVEKR